MGAASLTALAAGAKSDIEAADGPRDVPMGKPLSARRALAASIVLAPDRYVTIELFSVLTGFTIEAIRRRKDRGVWTFFIVRDGTVLVDREGYREWVSGDHAG